ncbi:MAG: N-acyl homoserine lactonase family protein [Microbacterium sp.]
MRRAADGVYALRYAHRTASVKNEHFYEHFSDCMGPWPIDYFTWVSIHDGRVVVIDTGFTPEEAARRGDRPYTASPVQLLARLGISADEVDDVVLTHLHYDHTGFVDAYPRATIHVQRDELDFWQTPMAVRGAYEHLLNGRDLQALLELESAGRVAVADGVVELDDRTSLHLVGGHTAGTQVVRIVGSDGAVVLASDASHFYANIEGDHPYGVVHELPRMYLAFDRLHELAGDDGVIVPGHDPRVRARHAPLPDDDAIVPLSPATARDRALDETADDHTTHQEEAP